VVGKFENLGVLANQVLAKTVSTNCRNFSNLVGLKKPTSIGKVKKCILSDVIIESSRKNYKSSNLF